MITLYAALAILLPPQATASIIKFEDEGKVKSGTFLMYQIKAFKKFLKKYSKVEFRYVTKFE